MELRWRSWLRLLWSVTLFSSMPSPKRLLLPVGLLLALSTWWVDAFIEQDRCLDDGGCWDHAKRTCEYQDQSKCEN